MKCEGSSGPCSSEEAKQRPCMTAYHWDGKGENPNKGPILCEDCAVEYAAMWKERWDEYYSGLL